MEPLRLYRIWVLTSTTAQTRKGQAPTKSIVKLCVASQFNVYPLREQSLFCTNPEVTLPLLCMMIGHAKLSIDELLGQLSPQFIEHLLVLSAQSFSGVQHKGRHTGEVRWHASQSGIVHLLILT